MARREGREGTSYAKRGHMNCQVKYSCRHQRHGKDGERYHVQPRGNPKNTELLMRYKRDFVDKYSKELIELSRNNKISMYSECNCANIGVSQVAATEDIVGNRGLFMYLGMDVEHII